MWNSALQLGSAVGLAIITTIQLSVDGKPGSEQSHDPSKNPYAGRAAAIWFLFAALGVEAIVVLVFFRNKVKPPVDPEAAPAAPRRSSVIVSTTSAAAPPASDSAFTSTAPLPATTA